MKALVVYESIHHGNTEKVAKAISKGLGAELRKASETDAAALGGYDLIGFGSGIYFNRHHRNILRLVKDSELSGKDVFVFSTAGFAPMRLFHHMELRFRLWRKGARMVGEFSCSGLDTYGPYGMIGGVNKGRPNVDDLEDAKEFGRGLVGRLRT